MDILRRGIVSQRDRSGIYGEFPQVIFKNMIPMPRVELIEKDGVIFQDMPPLRGLINLIVYLQSFHAFGVHGLIIIS